MNWFEFIDSIVRSSAWPVVAVFAVIMLKSKIGSLLLRLLAIKYKDFSLQFAQISKEIVDGKLSDKEKEEYQRQQVVYQTKYYRLYSNGILVQKHKIKASVGIGKHEIVYPITFPNEAVNISAVGDIEMHVIRLGQSNCTLSFPSLKKNEEIELIITGL